MREMGLCARWGYARIFTVFTKRRGLDGELKDVLGSLVFTKKRGATRAKAMKVRDLLRDLIFTKRSRGNAVDLKRYALGLDPRNLQDALKGLVFTRK